jgi:hypothetical protein
MKLKYKLPVYSIIDHLSLDMKILSELTLAIQDMNQLFQSVLDANKRLCSVNHELTKSVYDNFFQISLTESEFNKDDISMQECESSYGILHGDRMSENIRRKKMLASTENSPLNENLYNQVTEHYERYRNLFDNILLKFKSKPTRVRLVKLQAGTNIFPHIDYDPSYAVRIIIPVISTPECINLFWVKNEVISTTFEPGKAYFLNTGYKHAVVNLSKSDRYTFMVSVNGTKDIDHLIL